MTTEKDCGPTDAENDEWFNRRLRDYHNTAIDRINRKIGELMYQRGEHSQALDELKASTPEETSA